jgi:hypothetical protein
VYAIDVVDLIVIIYFTLEYFVRLICSPKKLKFMKAPLNLG